MPRILMNPIMVRRVNVTTEWKDDGRYADDQQSAHSISAVTARTITRTRVCSSALSLLLLLATSLLVVGQPPNGNLPPPPLFSTAAPPTGPPPPPPFSTAPRPSPPIMSTAGQRATMTGGQGGEGGGGIGMTEIGTEVSATSMPPRPNDCPMPMEERIALLALYNELDGPRWSLSNANATMLSVSTSSQIAYSAALWMRITESVFLTDFDDAFLDPCRGAWMGIQCWRPELLPNQVCEGVGVSRIILAQRGLSGRMPGAEVWAAFKGMRQLDLSANHIIGSCQGLSAWFTNLANWQHGEFTPLRSQVEPNPSMLKGPIMHLSDNSLAFFPIAEMNAYTGWYYVGLHYNQFPHDISTLFAYSSATPRIYPNLIEIDACCGEWSGTFPRGWSYTLPALRSFDFSQNQLASQPLPLDLPTKIERIILGGNAFYGELPKEWVRFTSMTALSIEDNRMINGTLPAWLGKLPNLNVLLVSNNQLSGSPWPAICGVNSRLYYQIYRNQFSGPISRCILGGLPTLLRSPFAELQTVFTLDFSHNRFNNSLSDNSLDFLNHDTVKGLVENLIFSHNELTAYNGFATWWSGMNTLHTLLLSNNPLNFTLSTDPNAVTVPPASTPAFETYDGINPGGLELALATSTASGSKAANVTGLSVTALRTLGQLVQLDLSSCGIRGTINKFPSDVEKGKPVEGTPPTQPSGPTNFERLVTLSLRNNLLDGDISIGKLAKLMSLKVLDISLNPLLTGDLDSFSTFESLIATGCPLLLWKRPELPPLLQIDSNTPYSRDASRPGVICPVFTGTDQQSRTFQVDNSYFSYVYCSCDSGFFTEATPDGKGFDCKQIPSITTLVATAQSSKPKGTQTKNGGGEGDTATARRLLALPSESESEQTRFSDAHYGSARMLVGLDTSWSIDASQYSSELVRGINVTIYFHPDHFTGSLSTDDTDPISVLRGGAYNRLEIFMGDETLSGDRVASFTGLAKNLKKICFAQPMTKQNYTDGLAEGWTHDMNSSPFNDTNCVLQTSVLVFSNQATLNFRSRDQSRTHFVASYTVARSCPSGYASPDALNAQLGAEVTPNTPFTVEEAWCAPVFTLQVTLQAIVISVAAIVGAFEIFLIACVQYYRDHSVMKSATPEYLQLVLFGLLLLDGGAITFALSPGLSGAVCDARIWLVGLGLILSLTAFDMKTERIRQIYSTNTLKRRTMSMKVMALLVFAIMTLECLALALQSGLRMYSAEVVVGTGSTLGEVVAQCSSSNAFVPWLAVQIIAMLLLLWWAAYNAWKIRRAAVAFNESNTAAASVVLYLFFVIALLPLQSLLADQPNAQMLIMGLGLALCSVLEAAATVCVKLYYIWSGARPLAALMHPIPTKLELPGEQSSDGVNRAAALKQQQQRQAAAGGGSIPKLGGTPKTGTPKVGLQISGGSRAQAMQAIPGMFKTSIVIPAATHAYRGAADGGVDMAGVKIGATSSQFRDPASGDIPDDTDTAGGAHGVFSPRANHPASIDGEIGIGGGQQIRRHSRSVSSGLSDDGGGDSREEHDRIHALSLVAAGVGEANAGASMINPLSTASYFSNDGAGGTGEEGSTAEGWTQAREQPISNSAGTITGESNWRRGPNDVDKPYNGDADESQNPLSLFPTLTFARKLSAASASITTEKDSEIWATYSTNNNNATAAGLPVARPLATRTPVPLASKSLGGRRRSSGGTAVEEEQEMSPVVPGGSAAKPRAPVQTISPVMVPSTLAVGVGGGNTPCGTTPLVSQPGAHAHTSSRNSLSNLAASPNGISLHTLLDARYANMPVGAAAVGSSSVITGGASPSGTHTPATLRSPSSVHLDSMLPSPANSMHGFYESQPNSVIDMNNSSGFNQSGGLSGNVSSSDNEDQRMITRRNQPARTSGWSMKQ